MVTSIMIVGVGGQGSLLASKLLGRAAMDKGYDVKVSEVHGMSQRGGSVVTYVKFGDKVNSPIIDKGEADYIISFELLEAARYVQFLKPGGQIVTNSQQIDPMPVIAGTAEYPQGLIEKMEAAGAKVDAIDALTIAEQAGNAKATNIHPRQQISSSWVSSQSTSLRSAMKNGSRLLKLLFLQSSLNLT